MRNSNRLPLEQLTPYVIEALPADAPNDWPELFGNERPVEIEVGFGKGMFLVAAAQACPDVNFLGIEVQRKLQYYAATRLAKRDLQNARVLRTDARIYLRDRVPAGSVQAMHVYFPDPWWKRRHFKRRLFTSEFAAACGRVLQPGGLLHVVTDVGEYFDIITSLVMQCPELEREPVPDVQSASHDLDYLTNFERKYRKEGRPIHRGRWQRNA